MEIPHKKYMNNNPQDPALPGYDLKNEYKVNRVNVQKMMHNHLDNDGD